MATTIPRPEHPRPHFVRPLWTNLNGEWEFAFDPDDKGLKENWQAMPLTGRIRVPFAPESSLSGVGDAGFHPVAWYARDLDGPAAWRGQRVILHFGAVDYACRVWLNGEEVGGHSGGYTPFDFDLTDKFRPRSNRLVVRAEDNPCSPMQPSGKQSDRPESYGTRYTRTTGIWQTVWLEAVGRAFLLPITRVVASLKNRTVSVRPSVGGAGAPGLTFRAELFDGARRVAWEEGPATENLLLDAPAPKPWAPGTPHLYTLRLTLRHGRRVLDRVRTYCGFRDVEISGGRVLLNGEPLYQKLVLDQRYYPDGIYTAPTDRALRRDIRLAQAVGFNGARVHQKVEDPRFLYWADRMGYLLWAEMPDWGTDLSKDEIRQNFGREWTEAVMRDWNHPSIVAWAPFNERRGDYLEDKDQQGFVAGIRRLTKELDNTRPAVDNDGYCHGDTDIVTIHDYSPPDKLAETWAEFGRTGDKRAFPAKVHQPHFLKGKRYKGEPVILSEIAGIKYAPGAEREGWGYGEEPKSLAEYARRYRDTVWAVMSLAHVQGYCVTQFADIEQEQNGVHTEDRKPKLPEAALAAIHAGPEGWREHPGAGALERVLEEG